MAKIQILDSFTANKIAAGEIIERPVSVIKELLENSLDAEADFIEIEIKEGGLSLIKVTDNGHGMDKEDALLAFERHATSKISNAKDLFNINTFGFRGEALPSIGAVSQVVLTTRDQFSETGTQIKIIGGQMESIEEIAFSPGTSVEVRNLFFNTPARRKFMKSLSYEAGLITELVTKYSLGHPQVRFKVINGREVVYDTAGLDTQARLGSIYGEELANAFLHISKEEFLPQYFVEAWLAKGHINRNTRNQQTFFINGRLVKNRELGKVLDQAYHTLIPKGRFPIALVKLNIPGHELDINIHPAKLEIKINKIEIFLNKLADLLSSKLWNTSIIGNKKTTIDYHSEAKKNIEIEPSKKNIEIDNNKENELNSSEGVIKSEDITFTKQYTEPKNNSNDSDFLQEPIAVYIQDNLQLAETNEKEIKRSDEKKEEFIHLKVKNKASEQIKVKNIDQLEPIGQLNNSFILAQNNQGLYIIDQHTCHERILYEKFMKEEENKEVVSENLLIPVTLNLSGQQEGIVVKSILILNNLGFVLENFGPRTYVLRSIPIGLKNINMEKYFFDLLEDLMNNPNLTSAKIKEAILTMAACKSAVKAKQSLNKEEMVYLLNGLAEVDNAHTCPHGRPIVHHISMQDLYKIFLRGEFRGV